MNSKLVSDEEVKEFMKPHLKELMVHVVLRRPEEPTSPEAEKTQTKKSNGENGKSPIIEISDACREYLESVFSHPNMTVTQRRDRLGLSTYKNNEIKKKLLVLKLIEQFQLNLGHETRGMVKFVELTEAAYKTLSKRMPSKSPYPCSPEHRFWQRNIHTYYKSQGYKSEIEMCLGNKRADIGFFKLDQTIAVEVELSPKNAVRNVKADLKAGFTKVLVACKDAKIKAAIETRFAEHLTKFEKEHTTLALLAEFSFVKAVLGKADR